MNATNELLERNRSYRERFAQGQLPAPPALKIAVVTCMDARIDPVAVLGIGAGEAHVIRNAGGVVTDDVIRSLSVSQHHLGTMEVVLMHHTACGMMTFTDEEFAVARERETGTRPPWPAGTFGDLEEDVRAGVRRVLDSAFIPHKQSVRGFVYEVESGRVREVVGRAEV
jgi:carbonic anhydrase